MLLEQGQISIRNAEEKDALKCLIWWQRNDRNKGSKIIFFQNNGKFLAEDNWTFRVIKCGLN